MIRGWKLAAWLALTLVSACLVPTTSAQASIPNETVVLSDAKGDVRIAGPGGASQTAPGDGTEHVDLTAVGVTETEDAFTFSIHVAGYDPESRYEQTLVFLNFRHGNIEFRTIARAMFGLDMPGGVATLYQRNVGSTEWTSVQELSEVTFSATVPGIIIPVPRDLLRNEDSTKPLPGRSFTDLHADTRPSLSYTAVVAGTPTVGDIVQISDQIPDAGKPLGTYAIQLGGLSGGGKFAIGVDRPFRSSNGEETTYLYDVQISNPAVDALVVGLTVADVPASWTIDIPLEIVTVAPSNSLTVPVLVSTMFFHEHGSILSFKLTATDVVDDSSYQTVELGVSYVAVPQPAGHHNTLWFHSRLSDSPIPQTANPGGSVRMVMNTLDEDDNDTRLPSRAENSGLPPEPIEWCIPLNPGLALGLDFDPSQVGNLHFTMSAAVPITGQIGGLIHVVQPDTGGNAIIRPCLVEGRDVLDVALIESKDVNIQAGQSVDLDLAVISLEAGDFVNYLPGQDLLLALTFTSTQPSTTIVQDAPNIEPGGNIQLPLLEYHEPLAGSTLADHAFTLNGQQSVLRNPGSAAVFEVVANVGGMSFDLLGTHRDWARLVQKNSHVYVVVQVPDEAVSGEIANLVLRGTESGDSPIFHHLRLAVEASNEPGLDDDSGQVASLAGSAAKGSPAPTALLVTTVLALFAALRRRSP